MFISLPRLTNFFIFIHDKDYFIINTNPFGLTTLVRKLYPNVTANHFYRLAMAEKQELNVADDPCNEDPGYSFQVRSVY